MKKVNLVIITVSLVLCIFLLFNILFKDTSVSLDLSDSDQTYYVTLLSDKKENGPWILNSEYVKTYKNKYESVWKKFENYDDEYYFIGNIGELSTSENYIWGYHCPKNFKVLIYSSLDDEFIESQKINSLFAKNYFVIKIIENELKLLTPFNGIPHNIFTLLFRFFLILVIEIGIAYVFKLRSKEDLKNIFKANMVSYILILFILQLLEINNIDIYFGLIICLKVISYFVKSLIYSSNIKNNKKYCFLANSISFIFGELLNIV